MASTKKIDFWFDFVSPYGYIASTQVEAIAQKHGRTIHWRPFLIGATFKVSGRKPPLQHPLVREYMLNDVARTARMLGVELKMPVKFPVLSVNPSRVFYWLQSRDTEAAKQFAQQVYLAYFVEGKDISKPGVVADIATQFDISAEQAHKLMKSPELKAQFKAVVDEAIAKKIFGAPMLDIEGELFWGVDHLSQADQWLEMGGW